jgi:hypothetical protein
MALLNFGVSHEFKDSSEAWQRIARTQYEVFQRFAGPTAGQLAAFTRYHFGARHMADCLLAMKNSWFAEIDVLICLMRKSDAMHLASDQILL